MVRYLTVLTLITIVIVSAPLSADNGDVPIELQAKLLLTALTYNNKLKEGEDKMLGIGCVYFPEIPQSKEQAVSFQNACMKFENNTVQGHTIKTVLIPYNGNDDFKSKLSEHCLEVLYVANRTKELCQEITQVTRAKKILSFTSAVDLVADCGLSMAVGLTDNKPKIYLNRASAQLEGAEFSAKFLRIAELVGEERK